MSRDGSHVALDQIGFVGNNETWEGASHEEPGKEMVLTPRRERNPRLIVGSCLPSAGRAKRANKINDLRVHGTPGARFARDPQRRALRARYP